MKEKDMRAADFAAQLRQDHEYLRKRAEQEQSAAGAEAAEREALEYLASRGYVATSFADLLQRYVPMEGELTKSLLDLLGRVDHPGVLDSVVRALGAAREDLDASQLIRLFEQTTSESLRWAIANTLAEARPRSAGKWILDSLQNRSYGKARELLALAAARANAPDVANPVLVRLLEELPGHAAVALAESGSDQELPALERAYGNSSGWERGELGRALSVIRARARAR